MLNLTAHTTGLALKRAACDLAQPALDKINPSITSWLTTRAKCLRNNSDTISAVARTWQLVPKKNRQFCEDEIP
jgi:hypothetical protein